MDARTVTENAPTKLEAVAQLAARAAKQKDAARLVTSAILPGAVKPGPPVVKEILVVRPMRLVAAVEDAVRLDITALPSTVSADAAGTAQLAPTTVLNAKLLVTLCALERTFAAHRHTHVSAILPVTPSAVSAEIPPSHHPSRTPTRAVRRRPSSALPRLLPKVHRRLRSLPRVPLQPVPLLHLQAAIAIATAVLRHPLFRPLLMLSLLRSLVSVHSSSSSKLCL